MPIAMLVNSLKDLSSGMLSKEFVVFKTSYWGDSVALWNRVILWLRLEERWLRFFDNI